jgi:hypothetical protein
VLGVSRAGGGGGIDPRLGGGGAGARLPAKGGGTPNLPPAGFSSSFAGVFGGRGGGGGPGLETFDEARALLGGAGGKFANFPASAMGGGARKTGFGGPGGGEGSWGGDGGAGLADDARLGTSVLVRRVGGGAGGGPRRDAVVLPVFWGLSARIGAALGGGGGGGGARVRFSLFSSLSFSSVLRCSMYSLMKSAFSSIWSSVMPIASSSFSSGRHDGSVVSMAELRALVALEWLLCTGDVRLAGGMMDCGGGADSAELRCPKMPPNRPWLWPELLPLVVGRRLLPAAAPKGLFLVFLCAFFSRSSNFFLNVLASFSSANDSAARQSSSSKVWKKTRSWL